MAKLMGIYVIENVHNNKFYIGSSVDINRRWAVHKSRLNRNIHHTPHLQSAWNLYGPSAFVFTIIKECVNRVDMLNIEHEILISWVGSSECYNVSVNVKSPTFGLKFSDTTKKRMSETHAGSNNHFYGKTHTESAKLKIQCARKLQRIKCGDAASNSKLTVDLVKRIKDMRLRGVAVKCIADEVSKTGVKICISTISAILNGRSWKHVQ